MTAAAPTSLGTPSSFDEAALHARGKWLASRLAGLDQRKFENFVRALEQVEAAPANESRQPPRRRATGVGDVLEAWDTEGALVHQPTGFARLDELTGGGPVYGSRWYLVGAPDAGKTAMLVQLADVFARQGVLVGLLAVDEEAGDIVTRLAQRAGWKRRDCEERVPAVLACMREALADLPIQLYDVSWTIEEAAEDLAAAAKERGMRAALLVDSIQSVRSQAGATADSAREAVSGNVAALRAVASRHRLITIATSEMNRGAYRSVDAAERSNDMAAAKESGAVEYSARVMLSLRSVKGEPDTLELRVVKNKHGPSDESVYLGLDRRLMNLTEKGAPSSADPTVQAREKDKARGRRIDEAAEALRVALLRAKCAPTSRKDLAGLVRGERRTIEAAISELLRDGRIEGGRGRAYRWCDRAPPEVPETDPPPE